jgi:hypothetical protein
VASSSGNKSLTDLTDLIGSGNRTKCDKLVAKHVGSRLLLAALRASKDLRTILGGHRDEMVLTQLYVKNQCRIQFGLEQVERGGSFITDVYYQSDGRLFIRQYQPLA